MIYTIQFTKPNVTFNSGEQANADRIRGLSDATLTESAQIDASLISQGILASPETYSWDQATSTLTITRDVSDTVAYFTAKDAVSARIYEVVVGNGWTRVKQMIPL